MTTLRPSKVSTANTLNNNSQECSQQNPQHVNPALSTKPSTCQSNTLNKTPNNMSILSTKPSTTCQSNTLNKTLNNMSIQHSQQNPGHVKQIFSPPPSTCQTNTQAPCQHVKPKTFSTCQSKISSTFGAATTTTTTLRKLWIQIKTCNKNRTMTLQQGN